MSHNLIKTLQHRAADRQHNTTDSSLKLTIKVIQSLRIALPVSRVSFAIAPPESDQVFLNTQKSHWNEDLQFNVFEIADDTYPSTSTGQLRNLSRVKHEECLGFYFCLSKNRLRGKQEN